MLCDVPALSSTEEMEEGRNGSVVGMETGAWEVGTKDRKANSLDQAKKLYILIRRSSSLRKPHMPPADEMPRQLPLSARRTFED